jgi:hypothetical protein
MPSNVSVRAAHALAFRSVGYVYKFLLASNAWARFPYLKEKMPRAARFRDADGKKRDFDWRRDHPYAGTVPENDRRSHHGADRDLCGGRRFNEASS